MIILLGLASLQEVKCQNKKVFNHDFLMPAKGKSMVEFYTGLPYVAIAQYSYGFGNRVSVGVIYGYTPFERGYGLRMKALLTAPSETFRLSIKSPFIYYPGMKNGENEPWVLAWPALNGEWKLKNGSRIWTGVGVVGAACVDYLFEPKGNDPHNGHDPDDPYHPPVEGEEMTSLYNTFQFGYSKPLSNSWSFVAEVAPVMEGFKLKSPNGFLDTSPIILTLGLSCSF